VERLNLGKVSELELTKEYHIKISNTFVALEDLYDNESLGKH